MKSGWSRSAALALIAAAGGALAALALRPGVDGSPATDLAAEIASLRDELEAERGATRALALEVSELRDRVTRWTAEAAPAPAESEPPPVPAPAAAPPQAAPPVASGPGFDTDSLRARGLDTAEATRLAEVYDESQLDLLYLRDRATREGWKGKPRYRREVRALQDELRAELGDADYDRLLYASGRPNRVVIRKVLARSPAEQAGLEPGDVVLSYDDHRIFDGEDLVSATTQGRRGESVAIEVRREGERQRFFVPRGPLGGYLVPRKEPPDPR